MARNFNNFKTVSHSKYGGCVRKTPSMVASTTNLTLEKNQEFNAISVANSVD
jgi:hypothetical protein